MMLNACVIRAFRSLLFVVETGFATGFAKRY